MKLVTECYYSCSDFVSTIRNQDFLKLGYKATETLPNVNCCPLNHRAGWGNELSSQPSLLYPKAQLMLLRSINSWCPGGQSSSFNGTSHNGGSKTQRAIANGMDRHAQATGWEGLRTRACLTWTQNEQQKASNAFPPRSNPSLECSGKAHFSSAMTGGLLRGVFSHPLVEITHIFKKIKQKQVTSGRSFPVEPTPTSQLSRIPDV